MNKVILIGRLIFDSELKRLNDGGYRVFNRVAVKTVDKFTTFEEFDVTFYDNHAHFASAWLKKGARIAISGQLSHYIFRGENRVHIIVDDVERIENT